VRLVVLESWELESWDPGEGCLADLTDHHSTVVPICALAVTGRLLGGASVSDVLLRNPDLYLSVQHGSAQLGPGAEYMDWPAV
jgi:hypothetical protein